MKKRFFSLMALTVGLLWSLTSCCGAGETAFYNQGVHIIPQPVSLTAIEGQAFRLNAKTVFAVADPALESVATFFAQEMAPATGWNLAVKPVAEAPKANVIRLGVDAAACPKEDSYILTVSPTGVEVTGASPAGVFYGLQSFLQLLPAEIESDQVVKDVAWTAPAVKVVDEPRFGYRGVMLDPCRHFVPAEFVKKQIDVLAKFKINRLHWHLTEDQGWRIEIKKYPKLTEVGSKRMEGEGYEYGGFYTQEEIKDVVAYAAERFITIVPELEIPGHELAAIAAYPELSCTGEPVSPRIVWGVEDILMCPGKEDMFKFIEDVLDEMVPLFPGTYFHIGGDECPKVYWKQCPLCQARIKSEGIKADAKHSAEDYLQSYVVRRVEEMLVKRGKAIIGWDEILEGELAPTATVMSWRGVEGGIAAASLKHDVIMTPSSHGLYIDYYQGEPKVEPVAIGGYAPLEKTYAYDPVPEVLSSQGLGKYVKGVQVNLWAEYLYTPEQVEYMLYPRALALAEVAWSPVEAKNFEDFLRRLDNANVRMDLKGINYHIPLPEQPGGSIDHIAFLDEVEVAFTTSRPLPMIYTLDGSEPVWGQAQEYTEPLKFTENATLKIRTALPTGRASRVREITLEKQTLAPAVELAKPQPGLNMRYAVGNFHNIDEAKAAQDLSWKPMDAQHITDIRAIIPERIPQNYAAIAQGHLYVPEDGVYYFSTNNEQFWIDGKLLIDNQNEVKKYSRHDNSAALAKGWHPIEVVFVKNITGGLPSVWDYAHVDMKKAGTDTFVHIQAQQLAK